ncbi:MAG: SufS family cysteine desulfurase [Planctomycetaceae bacterium]|nr:SufS family cysteine desulfurase [Planctomycetaceae bacterium]
MAETVTPADSETSAGLPASGGFNIDAVRADFPILATVLPNGAPLTYLDSGASAQKPQAVIDCEKEVYETYYANAYRGVYQFGNQVDEALEHSRERVRQFLGAALPEEIIFTSGTTMSINLVAQAWGRKNLEAGDEILLTPLEHHANIVPWQQIARERGATLRYLPLTADGQLDLEQLETCLTSRTKMVAVTGMSNVLGTLPPLKLLAGQAHARGAVLLVDGAQSVPHGRTSVTETGIDFLAFSGHKLYGPSGVGVLYGRRELLEAMDPFLTGGHMIERVFEDHSTWAPLPARFEAGTLPIAQAIALGAAVDYVEAVGLDAIAAREQELLEYAFTRLAEVPGLHIPGPAPDHRGSIISFTMEGAHPQDVAVLLDRKGICVRHGHHCTMPLHDLLGISASTRASFAFYNTHEEIDRLTDGLHFARQRLRLT